MLQSENNQFGALYRSATSGFSGDVLGKDDEEMTPAAQAEEEVVLGITVSDARGCPKLGRRRPEVTLLPEGHKMRLKVSGRSRRFLESEGDLVA